MPAAVRCNHRPGIPLSFRRMSDYADCFPELPGGSATGQAVEPRPFDLRILGEDRAGG